MKNTIVLYNPCATFIIIIIVNFLCGDNKKEELLYYYSRKIYSIIYALHLTQITVY